MTSIGNFSDWMRTHPEFTEKHIVKENDRWGRIVCNWHEKVGDKDLQHVFTASIDLKTGDIYLDCRKRKLFAKHLTLAFARPLHTAVRTLYHLSLAGVITNVYKAAVGKQTAKQAFTHSVKSLADIVRTPVYGTALTIVNIAAVAITPFSPSKLYDLRKLHGKIEQQLNWGEKQTGWTLALCFQSGFNVTGKEWGIETFSQEEYEKIKTKLETRINRCTTEETKAKLSAQLAALEDTMKLTELEEEIAASSGTKKQALQQRYDALYEKMQTRGDVHLDQLRWKKFDTTYSSSFDKKIKALERKLKKSPNDTDLKQKIALLKEERELEVRLTHFSRGMIRERRNVAYNPFYQIGKMDENKRYESAAIVSTELKRARILLEKTKKLPVENKDIQLALKNLDEAVKRLEKLAKTHGAKKEKIEKLVREMKTHMERMEPK